MKTDIFVLFHLVTLLNKCNIFLADHEQKPMLDGHSPPHPNYHPDLHDHRELHEHREHLQPPMEPRIPVGNGRSALDHLHDVVKSEIESTSMSEPREEADESADVDVGHHEEDEDEEEEHHYESEEEDEDVPRHRQVVVTPLLDHVKLANDVMNDANAAKIECPAPGEVASSSAVTSTSSSEAAEVGKKNKSNGISCQ